MAFSLASVPELQKKAFVREAGATETSFSAAVARITEQQKAQLWARHPDRRQHHPAGAQVFGQGPLAVGVHDHLRSGGLRVFVGRPLPAELDDRGFGGPGQVLQPRQLQGRNQLGLGFFSDRGHPGIEATVITASGEKGVCLVTAGQSVGKHEVEFVYDGGTKWRGKGVMGSLGRGCRVEPGKRVELGDELGDGRDQIVDAGEFGWKKGDGMSAAMGIAERLLALELAVGELQTVVRGVSFPASQACATNTERLEHLLGNLRLVSVLARAGYATPETVAAATDEALLAVDGVGEKALRMIRERVTGGEIYPFSK